MGMWKLVGVTFVTVLVAGCVQSQTYCEDKPKILFYRKEQAALVSDGDSETNNHVVISNVNKEFLACVSTRNVEWVYEGHGEPSKFQESGTVDIQKYEDETVSYCLTSQITFSNKQSDTELSKHTGRYTCREIGNDTNSVSVYVFASRKNSPTFIQSRKSVVLPLSSKNLTNIQNPTNSSKTLPVFYIPCVTTYPNVTVRLLKKDTKSGKYVAFKDLLFYNSKSGFAISGSKPLSEYYGEYKCISSSATARKDTTRSKMNSDDFVFVTLVKARTFQIYPSMSEVFTAGMLNLTCESDEPVIMKEVLPSTDQDIYSYLDDDDYFRDRSDDIVETTERTDQKSHVANYMELAPEPGRSGEIQCLTEKEKHILHTWKYRIIRKRAEKLSGIKFNKKEGSFTCKSKLGAPGKLSFVSCRTPSECRVNRVCLEKSENCRGYSNTTRAFCERKTHFCGKIFYKGGSGLIRCVGEGIDEIRGYTDEALQDQQVRMGFGKLKASETALLHFGLPGKRGKQSGKLLEGESVNVTLQMGYYYFLYPVQWAVKFKNGSTTQLSPDVMTLQVEKLTRIVSASVTLPYTTATTFVRGNLSESLEETSSQQPSEIVALHALIPLRGSVEPSWKTITLPLTVFGKNNVPMPVNEDEILIQEQDAIVPIPQKTFLNSTQQLADAEDDEDDEEEDVENPDLLSHPVESSNQTSTDSTTELSTSTNKPISTLAASLASESLSDVTSTSVSPVKESDSEAFSNISVSGLSNNGTAENVKPEDAESKPVGTEPTSLLVKQSRRESEGESMTYDATTVDSVTEKSSDDSNNMQDVDSATQQNMIQLESETTSPF